MSHIYFTKDFNRGFEHFLEKGITPIYNYEFKFDGELNMCKKLMFATKPKFHSLKGMVWLCFFLQIYNYFTKLL